ncbi:PIN domain-like protein [Mycena pura]|uniref:PIN domain-like protein n=1 Tax=Mycena pura TaxID=153505 RepID=A0AAD6VRR2_9AGAR|nr:PIN domain-like protein [Mycena pura]
MLFHPTQTQFIPQFLARPLLLACKAITSKPKFRHVQPERIFFNKLCRFLYLPAKFIFVFDGTQKPSMKRNKRGQVQEMWAHVRPLIHAFGFETHTAPGEGEAELAHMNFEGIIDAVLTMDGDALVFGAETVIFYRSSDIYQMPAISLDHNGLILFALLAGNDYNTKGLPGCGLTLARTISVSQQFADRLIKTFETVPYASTLHTALTKWKADICQFLDSSGKKSVAKNWPDDFPSFDLLQQLIQPLTSWSTPGNTMVRPMPLPPSLTRLAAAYEALLGGTQAQISKTFQNNIFEPYTFSAIFSVRIFFHFCCWKAYLVLSSLEQCTMMQQKRSEPRLAP